MLSHLAQLSQSVCLVHVGDVSNFHFLSHYGTSTGVSLCVDVGI